MERAVSARADEPLAGRSACVTKFRVAAMTVFACAHCGRRLTPNLRQVSVPCRAIRDPSSTYGYCPLMRPGTFAVDPEPFGPSDIRAAATRGTIIVNPSDIRGVEPHADYVRRSGCCRPAGTHGPNLVCTFCGLEVATEQTDCWTVPAVHFEPGSVVVRGGRAVSASPDSGRTGLRRQRRFDP